MPAWKRYSQRIIAVMPDPSAHDAPTVPAPSGRAAALSTPLLATVAVDRAVDVNLTYLVTADLADIVRPGARVLVPLGRSNKPVSGTVLHLESAVGTGSFSEPVHPRTLKSAQRNGTHPAGNRDSPFPALSGSLWSEFQTREDESLQAAAIFKPIRAVLVDVHPVPEDLLALARWISQYYCCPLGQVLGTMVPAAVKRHTRIPREIFVALAFKPEEIPTALSRAALSSRSNKAFHLVMPPLLQQALPPSQLLEKSGITRHMLKRLVQAGLLALEKRIILPQTAGLALAIPRDAAGEAATRPVAPALTADQQAAFENILPLLDPPRFAVRLIHGVTGSGKTELYIRCIEKITALGRTAIMLVPEISLTAQTLTRFTHRLARVAVLHSGLSDSQRHQHWHSVATGWAQVIIGARSAIFAPAPNLGLIVVDEEHEPSYKQDNVPRYHARDVAIRRAQLSGVPVLLGSATPALESWHNAHHNPHYRLLSLTSRPCNVFMPRVIVVDMKQERQQRRGLHALSCVLEHYLRKTLADNGQAIFLLNRRGYAHYVACARCDWILVCDHCDATMVVHRQVGPDGVQEIIQCHYCLTSRLPPPHCPLCQAKLVKLGQGTQRAQEELERKFPNLRLARMDSDAMRRAADYRETLGKFAAGELDLLLGTQMIAKGLDFPNVRLVGVLNADLAMTVPDFRAMERTFQLVCQVAGRSGRTGSQGLVVVQTMQPDEPAIVHASRHDYPGFAGKELTHRKEFGYPPFGRIVRCVVAHQQADVARKLANILMEMIQSELATRNLPIRFRGPQSPSLSRLMDRYRLEILLLADCAMPLQELLAGLRQRGLLKKFQGNLTIDVDPMAML